MRREVYAPRDEPVVLRTRPSVLAIYLGPLGTYAALAVASGVAWQALARAGAPAWGARVGLALAIALLLRLAWEHAAWLATRYVLTPRRLLSVTGVLRRRIVDVPADRIVNAEVDRSIRERVFGLGTLSFDTSGGPLAEIRWRMLSRPLEALGAVRRAGEGSAPGAGRGMPVLGLCGGIGAGKSHVARVLESLGWLVVDSDAEARAALDTPRVQAALRSWWGKAVVGADGRTDRSAVARIVFGNGEERARLEGLVHPLVRRSRAAMVEEARRVGRPGVVVDAPLLFEAGVDAECDAVIFVDAPKEERARRVRASRGWTTDELEKRERAQWPLEAKRARSRFVVSNPEGTSHAALERRVSEILKEFRVEPGRTRG